MLNKIALPDDRFETTELTNLRKRNYIFGKNGTGKTTLTNRIQEDVVDTDDVYVFNGYEQIIQNTPDGLDTISLGKINNELLNEINELNKQIEVKQKQISQDEENLGPVYQEFKLAQSTFQVAEKHFNELYTLEAKKINKQVNLGQSFNRTNLLNYAKKTSDYIPNPSEVVTLKQTLNTDVMKWVKPRFDEINFQELLDGVTEFCDRTLLKAFDPKFESNIVEEWVKEGYQLYTNESRVDKDYCFFCTQPLPSDRLDNLGRYFDNGILQLDKEGETLLSVIENKKRSLENLTLLNKSEVYPELQIYIEPINQMISQYQASGIDILNMLSEIISTKMNMKFSRMKMPTIELISLKDLDNELNMLEREMKQYSDLLGQVKKTAAEKLKKHLMYVSITSKEIETATEIKLKMEGQYKLVESKLKKIEAEISTLSDNVADLLDKSRDEQQAVDEMNKVLNALGNDSFNLEYVRASKLGLKGQYKVRGLNDGKIRDISMLSTGELNLIAFLWFINNLRSKMSEGSDTKLVVVFDDPMNSNDDASQYIMITELNRLMNELSSTDSQTFIMTHNIHFYMQLKPSSPKYVGKDGKESREAFYKFYKVNGKTNIKRIESSREDITTIYETLWDELIFAKENNKINFMWNTMRRILETYNRFMFSEDSPTTLADQLYNDTNKSIYLGLLKSLHVNSHVGYETDVDLSDITPDSLWREFKTVFTNLGDESQKHFEAYEKKAKKKHV